MASLSSTYASKHRQWPSIRLWPLNYHSQPYRRFLLPFSSPYCYSSDFPIQRSRQRPFVGLIYNFDRRIRFYRAGSSDSTPSPSPPTDPPPPHETVAGALSRIQDTVQIFFAVFFWMALFFWASAWDGRNGDKRNKGTRFKR